MRKLDDAAQHPASRDSDRGVPMLSMLEVRSARLTVADRSVTEGWAEGELGEIIDMLGLDEQTVAESRFVAAEPVPPRYHRGTRTGPIAGRRIGG